MKPVKVYSTSNCPYCQRAKNLLKQKGIAFQEIDLTYDEAARQSLQEKTGWMTLPMIFFGEDFIGGCDDLYALDESGELDKKLNT